MAKHVVIYAVAHQPRRLKLPAQPIPPNARPRDIQRCIFDESLNRHYFDKAASSCYHPATAMFHKMAEEGLRLSIGFSFSLLRQAEEWDTGLLARFQGLVANPNVELVSVEPYHSFIPLLDLPQFIKRMQWARDNLEKIFGQKPVVTDTTEMLMSDSVYQALTIAGFRGALMDGRPWVMEWRDPTYVYHNCRDLKLFTRHPRLSDDVGYRFSNRNWSGWPLMADSYAHWISKTAGDLVVLAWDYETFGEHHSKDTGIFEFMSSLPNELSKRRVETLTPSQALEIYGDRAFHLPLPAWGCTWAGEGGLEFFLGNAAQQAIFRLMLSAYNKARLTKNKDIIDLALWLAQSDNLHTIQWDGRWGAEAEVSAYFTPNEWWQKLGAGGILSQMQQVYVNFLSALDWHM